MSILGTLKNTFLPSADVSAARRQATFGTTSKAVAATAIVGAAVAAIAAPAVIASAPARAAIVGTVSKAASSVTKAIGSSFIKSPIATSAAVLVGAPLIAGVVVNKPSILVDLPKSAYKTGSKLIDVIEDNPIAAGAIGSVAGGVALYEGYKAVFGKDQSGSNAKPVGDSVTLPDAPSRDMPTTSVSPTGAALPAGAVPSSAIPVTAATQVLGKPAGSLSKRRKKKPVIDGTRYPGQRMSVNIYNQTKSLYTHCTRRHAWAT